ncbi:MAG: hypothetical protein WC713_14140 [Candidatus Methylomirabilota bacterium]
MEIDIRNSVEDGSAISAVTRTPESPLASVEAPLPRDVDTPEYRKADQGAGYYLTLHLKRADDILKEYEVGIGGLLFCYPHRKVELLSTWASLRKNMRYHFVGDAEQV